MAMGMEFLVKAMMDSMDEDTRKAIEAVPKNVAVIAEKLSTIDSRLTQIEEQKVCGRLETIEVCLVKIQAALLAALDNQARIESKLSMLDPSYTPDELLPTFAEFEGATK